MNNILLVTNNKNMVDMFAGKLILLRNTDRVAYCDYEDAPDIVFANNPALVILHENEDFNKTINLIKYIKTRNCSILLLVDKYDRNNVLTAYDEGIDDYFLTGSDPSEISIRTINCLRKNSVNNKTNEYIKYLKKYGIISEISGFYSKKHAADIFEENILSKDYSKGALTIIAANEDEKTTDIYQQMIVAIKRSIRTNDLVSHYGGTKFCILTDESGVEGALTITEKIKAQLDGKITVKAGICEIKNYTYQLAEKKAMCALSDAMLSNDETVIYAKKGNNIQDDWLDIPAEMTSNYKLFKHAFDKKLEKVITPVFYRMQKNYENKLKNTKIEQYTDEIQSVFRLTSTKQTSLLKLVYTGFTKIRININHAGLDSPENREILLSIKQITTDKLTEILESFIEEFKTTIK